MTLIGCCSLHHTPGNEFVLLREGLQNSGPVAVTNVVCAQEKPPPPSQELVVHRGPSDPDNSFSIVRLSVSGKVYVTLRKTLTFFPDTLLGSSELENFYNEKLDMYYFNRHRGVFNSILFFYQSRGVFRAPTNVDPDLMQEEMEFFKIDLPALYAVEDPNAKENEVIPPELTLREKLNQFLIDPQYSRGALIWSFADMVAIVVSIIMLVAESVPSANEYFKNKEKPTYYVFYGIEIMVNGFFTLDFILKFISWPKPWLFFKNILNFLDFMAILPFYMELVAMLSSNGSAGGKFVVLRICRTSRVVRIFRFVRHSKEMQVVGKVVTGASKEFGMLAMLILVFVLLFGTLLYYCEMGYDSNFISIPHGQYPLSYPLLWCVIPYLSREASCTYHTSVINHNPLLLIIMSLFFDCFAGCWWAIVTVTTVGYGDLAPKSTIGKSQAHGSLIFTALI